MFKLIYFSLLVSLSAAEISPQMIEQARKDFWAYRAPVNHPVPDNEGVWGSNPIDAFIFENFQKNKLTPSDPADKRELVRRVYFDLHGLPPTYEEVEEFVNDESSDAYDKLLEKLLDLPRYGERWGRHWLDVARYADTQGYNFTKSSKYPFAYTYRDYVIRAFNEDKPYDQFIKEQLAADLMDSKDKRNLAALGFLTTGERFLNKTDEIANDRIDVTTQAFMAMTVACARCHDHKVDPIPAADYYSLYGIFRSTHEPKMEELPIIAEPTDKKAYEKFLKDQENLKKSLTKKENSIFEKARAEWPTFADGVIDFLAHNRINKKKEKRDSKGRALRNGHVELFRNYISGNEGKEDKFYALLHHVYHRNDEKDIPNLVKDFSNRAETPAKLKEVLSQNPPKNRMDVYQAYRSLVETSFNQGKEDKSYDEIRDYVFGKKFNEVYNKLPKRKVVERNERDQLTKIENKLKDLMVSKGAPPRAMVINDNSKPYNPYIYIRGKAHDRGPNIKRRFPHVISHSEKHKEFKKGSGRLELAESIADPANPLTSRVLVNRIWQWHFGEGIVTTPSNFGKMGLPPSNLKLLDHLALKFVNDGWSIKKLHKYIMTSATYMQKSLLRKDMEAIDGANKYLWRMNLRRLERESLRDSMLQASGTLAHRDGGQAEDIMKFKSLNIRSVYGFLDREKIAGALKNFDFPSPQVTCEARIKTVVPQQGLFMMNSQMVTDCSKTIAAKLGDSKSEVDKVNLLFKKTLSRLPSELELKKTLSFIEKNKKLFNYSKPKIEYGIAKIENGQLGQFQKFDNYKDKSWKFKGKYPHPKYEYATLNTNGGHPGGNFPVVRRMSIFEDGEMVLEGSLKHPKEQGDGVKATLFVNGKQLQSWHSHNNSVNTNSNSFHVNSGDVIEFAVEPGKNHSFDSYTWDKKLKLTVAGKSKDLDLQDSYSGKQGATSATYSVWDALAQVMLMSNEFLYVD